MKYEIIGNRLKTISTSNMVLIVFTYVFAVFDKTAKEWMNIATALGYMFMAFLFL